MDDSSFCKQKPYPCTAEYYTLPHCLVWLEVLIRCLEQIHAYTSTGEVWA